ncbi:phosphoribosylamine--glycine ligase [Candidatus Bipolaricaulota sp. J31]
MRVLLVGNGAREHAIAAALARSPQDPRIFAYMSTPNPGIVRLAEDWTEGSLTDIEALKRYAVRILPDLVVLGPEAPLAAGAVDVLEGKGFPCVGPRKALARIEADKSFMRAFMAEHLGRGYPRWWTFSDMRSLEEHLRAHPASVIKPIGLTGGKGVRVLGRQLSDLKDALEYARPFVERDGRILVEERLEGEEFSLMVFTDGKRCVPMPLVQDYKYAREGDTGPMTGGMGSYSCADHLLPFISRADFEVALGLVEETVAKLGEITGTPYRGILYGQFIQTPEGPKVIEFNVRFGDPEAMNVLSLLVTDAVEVFASIASGDLIGGIEFAREATVCKYLVPRGYPEAPEVERPFVLPMEALSAAGIEVYFAAVREENGHYLTTSSRSVALLVRAPSPSEAKAALDDFLAEHCPEVLYYRRDIPRIPSDGA